MFTLKTKPDLHISEPARHAISLLAVSEPIAILLDWPSAAGFVAEADFRPEPTDTIVARVCGCPVYADPRQQKASGIARARLELDFDGAGLCLHAA